MPDTGTNREVARNTMQQHAYPSDWAGLVLRTVTWAGIPNELSWCVLPASCSLLSVLQANTRGQKDRPLPRSLHQLDAAAQFLSLGSIQILPRFSSPGTCLHIQAAISTWGPPVSPPGQLLVLSGRRPVSELLGVDQRPPCSVSQSSPGNLICVSDPCHFDPSVDPVTV